MQINLSEETIKTVWKSLTFRKKYLEDMLFKVECGKVSKEREEDIKIMLEEVEEALQVFDEMI